MIESINSLISFTLSSVNTLVKYSLHSERDIPAILPAASALAKSTPFVRITHIDGDNSNNRIWNLKTYDSSVENDSDSDVDEAMK